MKHILLSVTIISLIISGCGPTYPKTDLAKAVVDVCKKEYKADVKAKILAKTLGVYMPVDGIFELQPLQDSSNKSISDILSNISFKKDAANNIDDVILATTRVVLSTDSDINFYVAVIHDKKVSDVELVFTRNILDIKRIMTGDISRGDYLARLIIDIRFNPKNFSEKAIRGLFGSLAKKDNVNNILTNYFLKPYILSMGKFIFVLQDNAHTETADYLIEDIKTKRIAPLKILAYCKVKQTYVPKKEKVNFKFTYPSGFNQEYLMLIDASNFECKIERIIPLYSLDEKNNLIKAENVEEYNKFGTPDNWTDDDFIFYDIKMEDFLSRQIRERIKGLFQSDKKLKTNFRILGINEEFDYQKRQFIFRVITVKNDLSRLSEEELEIILKTVLDTARMVVRRYNYRDFSGIEVIEETADKKAFASLEYLDKAGRWPIDIKKLIQPK